MTEHIVAVFETNTAASAAARELEQAGVPATAIRQYAATAQQTAGTTATTETTSHKSGGFWSWLLGEDETTGTRSAYPGATQYDNRVQAGNTVLSITLVDDSLIHRSVTILDAHHPLDVDESTEETPEPAAVPTAPLSGRVGVVASGTEYSSSATTSAADVGAIPGQTRAATQEMDGAPAGGRVADSSTAAPVRDTPAKRDDVVQLAEERLDIGKRVVDRGTTRVRRFVVETPVERDVTLHEERVTIERRRPTDPAATPDANAFEERVIESQESQEVPVVAKTARIVEEVALKREASTRTETVRDTVRHDEVEITDDKSSAPAR